MNLLYPGTLTHILTQPMVDAFLLWAVAKGASDIVFAADDPPWVQIDGKWYAAAEGFSLTAAETRLLTNAFSGQEHKAGNVQRGMSADFAYVLRIPNERGIQQRFRVNVTGSQCGHYIVLRVLPRILPNLHDLALPDALVPSLYPQNGIVIISGVMGSGKSTLLAAVLHAAMRTKECGGLGIGRQILTLEQPIEFDFSKIPKEERSAPFAQSEVELHVASWADGVRSMTRRKGEIVMVGEARDTETLRAMLQIVEQGVTCYATIHAQDVPQTLTRIIHAFPEEERAGIASLLTANLRLIIHQRLVPHTGIGGNDRGRMALREYLAFTESVRMQLYTTSLEELIPRVRRLVAERGKPLARDAKEAFARGAIGEETYAAIVAEQEAEQGKGHYVPGRR